MRSFVKTHNSARLPKWGRHLGTAMLTCLVVVALSSVSVADHHKKKDAKPSGKADAQEQAAQSSGKQASDKQTGSKPNLGVVVVPTPGGSPLVVQVRRGSAAAKAGIRKGDFIVAVQDKSVKSPQQLVRALKKANQNGLLQLTTWRNGQQTVRDVRLPRQQATQQQHEQLAGRAWLGAMIRPTAEEGGVEIARIYLEGPADQAGLEPGDRITKFNGKQVKSPRSMTRRLKNLDPGTEVELLVEREGQQQSINVTLGNLEDFHEQLFGKRFRGRFDDFHRMFDPDFDGIPERILTFRVPTDANQQSDIRGMVEAMRKELKELREELRKSNRKNSKDRQQDESAPTTKL